MILALFPGVGFLPLACSAACPGFLARGPGSGGRGAAVGMRDRVGAGQAAAAGGPQAASNKVQPFVFAVPAFGQVQGDVAAAVAGGAGGDGDQVAADGRGPGLRGRAGWPARRRRGAGCAPWPRWTATRRSPRKPRMAGERAARSVTSAKTCSTMAWSRCCPSAWTSLERRVGEDGVVAPERGTARPARRAAWLFRSRTRRTISRAVTAWPFFDANAVYCTSATSASEIQPAWLVVPDRARVADRGPGVLADGGDRGADAGGSSGR